LCKMWNVKQ